MYTVSDFNYERTDHVSTLGDGFRGYYLGWMYWDNIPSIYKASTITLENGILSATPANTIKNSPVGYTTDDYEYNAWGYSGYIPEDNFSLNNNYLYYLNDFLPRSNGTNISIGTGVAYNTFFAYTLETGTDDSYGIFNSIQTISLTNCGLNTIDRIIGFFTGQVKANFSLTISGNVVSFEFGADDLEENGYYIETGIVNTIHYRIYIYINNFGVGCDAYSTAPNNTRRQFHILPFLKMYSENGNYYAPIAGSLNYSSNPGNQIQFYKSDNSFYPRMPQITGIGYSMGFEFDLNIDNLSNVANSIDFVGNVAVWHVGGTWNEYKIFRIYKPSEIKHFFALHMRLIETNYQTFGYHVSTYCPEVTDDSEFTGNMLTGELIETDVQPWQWDNITADDFTEDDIPEYEPVPIPPGPEPIDYQERNLEERNNSISDFINRFIDGRAGTVNSFNSTTMIGVDDNE